MLQIIGWLGCVYLLVKGIELLSSNSHRSADGKLHTAAMVGALIAFGGSLLFFVMLSAQASSAPLGGMSSAPSSAPSSLPESLTVPELSTEDLDAAPANLDNKMVP